MGFLISYLTGVILAFVLFGIYNRLSFLTAFGFEKIPLDEAVIFSLFSWVTVFVQALYVAVIISGGIFLFILESSITKYIFGWVSDLTLAAWEIITTYPKHSKNSAKSSFKKWFENKDKYE